MLLTPARDFCMRTECLFWKKSKRWSRAILSMEPLKSGSVSLTVSSADEDFRTEQYNDMTEYVGMNAGFKLRGERFTLTLAFVSSSLTIAFSSASLSDSWIRIIVRNYSQGHSFPLRLDHQPGEHKQKEEDNACMLFVKGTLMSIIRIENRNHLFGSSLRNIQIVNCMDSNLWLTARDITNCPSEYFSFFCRDIDHVYTLLRNIRIEHNLLFRLYRQYLFPDRQATTVQRLAAMHRSRRCVRQNLEISRHTAGTCQRDYSSISEFALLKAHRMDSRVSMPAVPPLTTIPHPLSRSTNQLAETPRGRPPFATLHSVASCSTLFTTLGSPESPSKHFAEVGTSSTPQPGSKCAQKTQPPRKNFLPISISSGAFNLPRRIIDAVKRKLDD